MVPVVVAARDIEPGTTQGDGDLKVGHVDPASAPVGGATSPSELAGRVTKVALSTNQAVLQSLLAEQGSGTGVAATLPPGMRAITVAIDEVSGVAGFITPQSKVDLVTTVQVEGKQTAKTMLERIQVLAVGGRLSGGAQPGEQPARNVTLLVTPEQAEQIELATNAGRVRMLLRNGRDESDVKSDGTTLVELRDGHQNNEVNSNTAAKAVPVGFRALTVAIDDVSGVNGFIQPNAQVDVIGTITAGGKAMSRAVLEKVTVIAIGSRTNVRNDDTAGKTATLLVTPEQAEKLAMLISSGTLRLSLRNGQDEAKIDSNGVTVAELAGNGDFGGGDPFAPIPGTNASDVTPTTNPTRTTGFNKSQWTIEIIKAGQTSNQTFQVEQERPAPRPTKAPGTAVSSGDTN
jgi:pilus assembly protein CpaB